MQVRWQADRPVFTLDEEITLKAQVRNRGPGGVFVTETPPSTCELELDGTTYIRPGGRAALALLPRDGQLMESVIGLDRDWRTRDGQEIRLAVGKHVARITFKAWPGVPGRHIPIRVTSNPVEITLRRAMPGSRLTIRETVRGKFAFAAVCQALEAADVEQDEEGVFHAIQPYKVAQSLVGGPERPETVDLHYDYLDVPGCREQAINKGGRLIWIVHRLETGPWVGVKALDETLENQATVCEAGRRPLWITLLALSPIKTATELRLSYLAHTKFERKLDVQSVELEIRSADARKWFSRVSGAIRLPEELGDRERFPEGVSGTVQFDPRQLRRVGHLPEGDYLAAINVDATRCSNVALLRVDPGLDTKREPPLRVVPLVLGPDQESPCVGLVATGPEPPDRDFTNMSLAFAELIVDGIERRPLATNSVRIRDHAGPLSRKFNIEVC